MSGQDDTCCWPSNAVVSTGVKERMAGLNEVPGRRTWQLVKLGETKKYKIIGYELDCGAVEDVHEEGEESNVRYRDPNAARHVASEINLAGSAFYGNPGCHGTSVKKLQKNGRKRKDGSDWRACKGVEGVIWGGAHGGPESGSCG